MKKSELKKIIKPIVQECIQESLLESGLVANVVSEVMKGMMPLLQEATLKSAPVVRENPLAVEEDYFIPAREQKRQAEPEMSSLQELRASRNSAIQEIVGQRQQKLEMSIGGINIFEGVSSDIPAELNEEARATGGALADSDPRDPGVNLAAFGIRGKMKQIK